MSTNSSQVQIADGAFRLIDNLHTGATKPLGPIEVMKIDLGGGCSFDWTLFGKVDTVGTTVYTKENGANDTNGFRCTISHTPEVTTYSMRPTATSSDAQGISTSVTQPYDPAPVSQNQLAGSPATSENASYDAWAPAPPQSSFYKWDEYCQHPRANLASFVASNLLNAGHARTPGWAETITDVSKDIANKYYERITNADDMNWVDPFTKDLVEQMKKRGDVQLENCKTEDVHRWFKTLRENPDSFGDKMTNHPGALPSALREYEKIVDNNTSVSSQDAISKLEKFMGDKWTEAYNPPTVALTPEPAAPSTFWTLASYLNPASYFGSSKKTNIAPHPFLRPGVVNLPTNPSGSFNDIVNAQNAKGTDTVETDEPPKTSKWSRRPSWLGGTGRSTTVPTTAATATTNATSGVATTLPASSTP